MGKPKEPRKHHYVPVFYQRLFANSDGLLWVYDRKLRRYRELPQKTVCVEEDLYAIRPEGQPRDRSIESGYLSHIDALGAQVISAITPGTVPSLSQVRALSFFMAHQYTRLPSYGRQVRAAYEAGFNEMMRLTFTNVERATSALQEYAAATGSQDDSMSASSLVEAVKHKQIVLTATERPFLQSMITQAQSFADVFANLDWQILVAAQGTGFIICDNPFVTVPPKGVSDVGFGIPGAIKYFPLNRTMCARLGDIGYGFAFRHVDGASVRIVNQNIAANSERFIMGPSQPQLEAIVRRSASTELDPTPRYTVETFFSDDEGALQKFTIHPTRYFYGGDAAREAP